MTQQLQGMGMQTIARGSGSFIGTSGKLHAKHCKMAHHNKKIRVEKRLLKHDMIKVLHQSEIKQDREIRAKYCN